MSAYKAELIAKGVPKAEAEALMAKIEARAHTDPDFIHATFNRRYSRTSGDFASTTVEPNAFLAETIAGLPPGKALDIGMGLGRNTIFLAQKGWDSTGIDLSDIGVAKAQDRARSLGVHINAIAADVSRFDLGTNQWDLVCLLYLGMPEEVFRDVRPRIASALKPGGLVAFEMGYSIDDLLAERLRWEPLKLKLLRIEYRSVPSDWGRSIPDTGHFLLQKPAS
jgi:SAM-dependent methyltransferase